jgi:hypothetical protein
MLSEYRLAEIIRLSIFGLKNPTIGLSIIRTRKKLSVLQPTSLSSWLSWSVCQRSLPHSMSSLCRVSIHAYGRAGAGWRMEPNKMTGKSGDLSQIYFLILVGVSEGGRRRRSRRSIGFLVHIIQLEISDYEEVKIRLLYY